MKKFIVALLLSILPLYSAISWVYIFFTYSNAEQSNRIRLFNEFFFNIDLNHSILAFVNIVLSSVALFVLTQMQSTKSIFTKLIQYSFMVILALLAFYHIVTLM